MAFCRNCGAQMNDEAKFCPVCGAVQAAQPAEPAQPVAAEPVERTDEEKYRYLAALSYLNVIFMMLALLVGNDSNYVRHHANQVACLMIWYICCAIVFIVPILGWIVGGIGMIAGLVITIICIVKALQRKYYEIPIFGKIRIIPEK